MARQRRHRVAANFAVKVNRRDQMKAAMDAANMSGGVNRAVIEYGRVLAWLP